MSKVNFDSSVWKKIKDAAIDGVEDYVRTDLMPDSDEHCPTDKGPLKESHSVERVGDTVLFGYGGQAGAYVEAQYLDTTYVHDSPEEDHWVEKAQDRQKDKLAQKVTEHIKTLTGG